MRTLLFITALVVLTVARLAFGAPLVEIRQSRQYVLSATPQAIGNATNRRTQEFFNDRESAGSAVCGYSSSLLSATPGPDNGNIFAPGDGKTICEKADAILYCKLLTSDAATLNNTDAYLATATSTPTPTVTPTPTP